jgi:hypothetical protein
MKQAAASSRTECPFPGGAVARECSMASWRGRDFRLCSRRDGRPARLDERISCTVSHPLRRSGPAESDIGVLRSVCFGCRDPTFKSTRHERSEPTLRTAAIAMEKESAAGRAAAAALEWADGSDYPTIR